MSGGVPEEQEKALVGLIFDAEVLNTGEQCGIEFCLADRFHMRKVLFDRLLVVGSHRLAERSQLVRAAELVETI